MQQVWILHNPLAGSPANAPKVERAAEALARRGVAVHLERPSAAEGMRRTARAAIAAGADAVLVAGGDGSLGTVAGEVAGSPVALGFLPAGTANVWAKEVGLPLPSWYKPDALERATLWLMEGQVRLADLGLCNDIPFLLWSGVGLDAFVMDRLVRYRPFSRRFGLAYNTAATFVLALQWHGADMRVVVEGREFAGHYLLALVSNICWYGGGMFRLRNETPLDDGRMDVWLFEGRTYGEALAHSARMFVGRHVPHPRVTCLTAQSLEIYTAAPQVVHTDGEPLAPTGRASIRVVPRAVRILVPPTAPRGLFSHDGASG